MGHCIVYLLNINKITNIIQILGVDVFLVVYPVWLAFVFKELQIPSRPSRTLWRFRNLSFVWLNFTRASNIYWIRIDKARLGRFIIILVGYLFALSLAHGKYVLFIILEPHLSSIHVFWVLTSFVATSLYCLAACWLYCRECLFLIRMAIVKWIWVAVIVRASQVCDLLCILHSTPVPTNDDASFPNEYIYGVTFV